jgi:DNA-binding CsgD family transcriptional regulator
VSELDEVEVKLLRLLTEGRTNREIAEQLAMDEPDLLRRLGGIFARIGVQSRAEATAFALKAV